MDTARITSLLASLNNLDLQDRLFIVEQVITSVRTNDEQKLKALLRQVQRDHR